MGFARNVGKAVVTVLVLVTLVGGARAAVLTETFILDQSFDLGFDPNGLSVKAVFVLDPNSPTQLEIDLYNTSTGVPAGFGNEEQLLTAISFDFGEAGYNGDPKITAGTVVIGSGGQSLNFDNVVSQLGPGDDVSGEWGYGNEDGTGLLTNFVSAHGSQATLFSSDPNDNLDGPSNLDGPQGGIAVDPPLVSLTGLGAVYDYVHITLTLDSPLTNLDFLYDNGVMAEFGSDAAHMVPEPASFALLALGGVLLRKRR